DRVLPAVEQDEVLAARAHRPYGPPRRRRGESRIGECMIQLRTWLDVADNSGPKRCHAIKVLGRGNKSTAEVGDIVVASVKKAIPSSTIKPGAVVRGVVVRTRNATRRSDGTYVRFDSNAIVLINDDKSPKCTR